MMRKKTKNDNDFLVLYCYSYILLYLAKEGKGPFCSEVSFPVGSPPMSDCKCWTMIIMRTMMMVVNIIIMMIMTGRYEK